MPLLLSCPSCSSKLRVADTLLGKLVKCPKCETKFPALEAPPPAAVDMPPPEMWQTTPPPADIPPPEMWQTTTAPAANVPPQEMWQTTTAAPPALGSPDGIDWDIVRRGLLLVLLADAGHLGWTLIDQVVSFALTAAGQPRSNDPFGPSRPPTFAGVMIGWLLFGLVVRIGLELAALVGSRQCAAAPAERGARSLAWTGYYLRLGSSVLVLMVFAVFALQALLSYVRPQLVGDPCVALLFLPLAVLFRIGAHFVYLFYLRAVALIASADGLAGSILFLIYSTGAAVVAAVLALFMVVLTVGISAAEFTPTGARPAPAGPNPGFLIGAMICCMGVEGLFALGNCIWYLVSIGLVRSQLPPSDGKAD